MASLTRLCRSEAAAKPHRYKNLHGASVKILGKVSRLGLLSCISACAITQHCPWASYGSCTSPCLVEVASQADFLNTNKSGGFRLRYMSVHDLWETSVPLLKRRPTATQTALGEERRSFSAQRWWGYTWSAVSSSGPPSIGEIWTFCRVSNKEPSRWWRD